MQNLQSASDRINTEAENLTKALKGDNKIQGNWGELVLERILKTPAYARITSTLCNRPAAMTRAHKASRHCHSIARRQGCCGGFKGHAGGLRASPELRGRAGASGVDEQHVDAVKGKSKNSRNKITTSCRTYGHWTSCCYSFRLSRRLPWPWKWIPNFLSMRLTNASCW